MSRFLQLLILALSICAASAQTTWRVDNVTNIGGHAVTKLGNPRVISTPYGNAIHFNGINDGLIVSNNPLAGWSKMTVELVFKPDALTVPTAHEPRILHVQSSTPPDHRLTIEIRVNTNATLQTFHLDTLLKFGAGDHNLVLFNKGHPHPVGKWTHVVVTFDGKKFCNYVNGQLELQGEFNGTMFTNTGATWIGQRANNVDYFEGDVLAVRFTPRVLGTNDFMRLPVPDR